MTRLVVDIPVIETERLILRAPRHEDLDAVADFMASPRSRFVGGPVNRTVAWRQNCVVVGHWVLRGYGMWTVEDRQSGKTAGRVGFIFHDGWPEPELGWHIYNGFEGQGIAFEAAKAARQAGPSFGLDGVISLIDAENTRSLALADRLGARFEREAKIGDDPMLIYRHPKEAA